MYGPVSITRPDKYPAATAGHYVPATAQVIVESKSEHSKNLKGIGIGNGWVDPKLQYGAYSKVQLVVIHNSAA